MSSNRRAETEKDIMELSGHEMRVLQELEQDLSADYPRLARTLGRTGNPVRAVRRLVLGAAVMGLGIGTMVYALALGSVPLGAAAFAVMIAGTYAASPPSVSSGLRRACRRGTSSSRPVEEQ
ncbi:molybdopterin converting factor small subunit [Arthrobacter silviterrae]|uniref:DUF3040 domain-containing protein n=1 Tax=Arthrobacter silviterrae TaxID=2026658 RepID=A0ABX0DEN2_9MICC|nr:MULTISPECIES: DUF3040 domain-containing protein [Arthrobacter]MCU6482108.1 DUF3040 domain-containing protein [Arthrobacter sp. A2-55]MDQ0275987.1 molybdopterin converting factor small subunit [Arthrobacter silviterrae]NGN85392.1 DUF3040 domain-containing protein [Arthrobacter silviterrae]